MSQGSSPNYYGWTALGCDAAIALLSLWQGILLCTNREAEPARVLRTKLLVQGLSTIGSIAMILYGVGLSHKLCIPFPLVASLFLFVT
eukprot:443940-Amorphochlora_amoeboformis.AAC.1